MNSFFKMWMVLTMAVFFIKVRADDSSKVIACNSTSQCPEDLPCCSQYGQCGTGAYCLGGCDIRYSFNLTACMPMPKMDQYDNDFDNTDIFEKQELYLGNSSETDWVYTGYVDVNDDAIILQMPNQSTGTVISSTKYIWYGKISATLKSSRDRGVITAFILFSDVQDEIDYEFVGYNLTSVQTNYYYQGILNYTNSDNSSLSNTYENWHDYEIYWNEDRVDWYVDGNKVRTLNKNETYNETSKRYEYPQTPARVQFSLWPGGDSRNGLGTIEWAGGAIDWDSEDIQKYGYYYSFVKNVSITPYDLPAGVDEIDDPDVDSDDFNAFLYNNTEGIEDNIYLTNKKTWLGSGDASGLDPDNDSDDEDNVNTETVVSGSGSDRTTETKTSTKGQGTVNVPDIATTGAAAKTTSIKYNPSMGVGGFVQDSQATETSAANGKSNSGTSSSSNAGSGNAEDMMGIFIAMVFGFISLFI